MLPLIASELNKLACFVAEKINETSLILSGLAIDVDSVWHATLQNHAPIYFLLLAHGCGCKK